MSIHHFPVDQLSDRHILDFANKGPVPCNTRNPSLTRNVILNRAATVTDSDSNSYVPVPDFDDTIHFLSPAGTDLNLSDDGEGGGLYGYEYKTPAAMQYLQEYELPAYASTIIPCEFYGLQRTLAMVKPSAMEFEEVILRAIEDEGFYIISKRYLHLTPEQVSEIYAQHYGSPSFPYLVVSVSSGPILSICMARKCAVEKWREMVGPGGCIRAEWFYPMSMRVRFGLRESIGEALHASENHENAKMENRYVNPESIIDPVICEENKVWDFCNEYINPTLLNGLVEVVRTKPMDPIICLAEWLLNNNPYQPRFPPCVAILPT